MKKVIRCDEKEMDLIVKSLQNFRTDLLLKNNFTDAVDEIYLKIVSKFYKIK